MNSRVALYPLSSPNHNPNLHIYRTRAVALYPLSSPNHNNGEGQMTVKAVALYPLSSPNHNLTPSLLPALGVALYPLSSPNHNQKLLWLFLILVALYPLSSPNHNPTQHFLSLLTLRYILFHHQTTTHQQDEHPRLCCVISSFITKPQHICTSCLRGFRCVISSFITKPQPVFLMCCNMIQLHDEYCTGNGMANSLSMAKLLKKLKLHRLLLYFLFYLSPYIDDVGVLLVGYCDYTKSSLAGHEEFYSLDVYIP